jgi:PIN domain nuclease of toxin-antitoxin system
MKFLLDTHIWLWSAVKPDRLTARVQKTISDPQNEVWLSPVSIWELALLSRKKRFRVQPDVPTWAARSIAELQISEAPLTFEVVLALSSMTFSHGDPADQFIAATAAAFDMTLVTADEQLLKIREIPVLANR